MSRLKGKLNRLINRFQAKFTSLVDKHTQGYGERGIKDKDA